MKPAAKIQELKIVLIGISPSGKTALVQRFVSGIFTASQEPTLGASFSSKLLTVSEIPVKLLIWDASGQGKYESLIPLYLRGCNGVMLCFNLTNKASLQDINERLQDAKEVAGQNLKVILVGTGSDLESERAVTFEEAAEVAKKLGIAYIETSAKTGQNVAEVFERLTMEILSTGGK